MLTVVRFTAPWCGPCKQLKPIMQEVNQEHPDVEFKVVDVDEDLVTPAAFGVMGIPRVLLIKNNEVVADFTGVKPKEFINELINNNK